MSSFTEVWRRIEAFLTSEIGGSAFTPLRLLVVIGLISALVTSNFFSGLILLFERPIRIVTESRLPGASERSRRSRHVRRPSSRTRMSRSLSPTPSLCRSAS